MNHNDIQKLCLCLPILLVTVLLSLSASYFWHRGVTHIDFPFDVNHQIHLSHIEHHETDESHEAHGDLKHVVKILVPLTLICMAIAVKLPKLFGNNDNIHWYQVYIWIIIIGVVGTFLTDWFMHMLYHKNPSWLQNSELFQEKRRLHFVHHQNPSANYGISTQLMDKVFDTFSN